MAAVVDHVVGTLCLIAAGFVLFMYVRNEVKNRRVD